MAVAALDFLSAPLSAGCFALEVLFMHYLMCLIFSSLKLLSVTLQLSSLMGILTDMSVFADGLSPEAVFSRFDKKKYFLHILLGLCCSVVARIYFLLISAVAGLGRFGRHCRFRRGVA